jgi:AcrR family transcriptional regulator
MPKLWAHTVETHRHEVREAIQDTTVALVAEHGLRSVTMSQIAERTGIGRATLYKYFPAVESILQEWHERQIHSHLQELVEASEGATDPFDRLTAVLNSYALIVHGSQGHRDTELAALLHGHHGSHDHAEQQLRRMVRTLVNDAVVTGAVRDDVSPDELTDYSLHALTASRNLASKAAVGRLVHVILAGLAPEKPHKKPTR